MFKAARIERIKEIITEKKQVDVSTLSSLLSVTEVTIRNDLDKLEQEGFITKTHGGAMLNVKNSKASDNKATDNINNVEVNKDKEYIGQIAACMVKERESIFLGSGVTCYYVAKALSKKKNINIVTNNLHVANILASNSMINVVLSGGNLINNTMALGGDIVSKSLEGIFVDKAFISVTGIHMSNGFTVPNLEELNVFKTIMNMTNELIVVADYTKFDRTSFVKLGPLNIAKKVITNENIPSEYKAYFFEDGIQIYTSYDINPSDEEE
jgi:Transcriptional regulators of sugar metabolism